MTAPDLTARVKPPWPSNRWPTATEWSKWFVSNPPGEREAIAERVLAASEDAYRCLTADHRGALEALRATMERVEALADEWADEGAGLGAAGLLTDLARELRAAIEGTAP